MRLAKNKIIKSRIFRYVFFGILTSILNVCIFWIFMRMKVPYAIANFITLIIVKVVSYVVNRIWVFKSKVSGFANIMKEFFLFMVTRGLTMLIDFFGVVLLVEFFNFNPTMSKYTLIIVIVIINFFFGNVVFASREEINE